MKKYRYIIMALASILYACNEDDTNLVVEESAISEANDDQYSIISNQYLELDFLSNDVIETNAGLVYIDEVSTENGVVSVDDLGNYTYTPATDFIGEDTFTYTLCEGDFPYENCNTGTVTITVEEEVEVEIVTTAYTLDEDIDYQLIVNGLTDVEGFENQVANIDNWGNFYRKNETDDEYWSDSQIEDALAIVLAENFPDADEGDLFEVTYAVHSDDASEEVMTLQYNEGEFSYYIEEVTNEYAFNIPDELLNYYMDLLSIDSSLLSLLNDITENSHTTILSYGERHNYLYDADADLNDIDNVILMYSNESRGDDEWISGNNSNTVQTYNTEHIFPQTFLEDDFRESDLHNLRVCDEDVNSTRSNDQFVEGSGEYGSLDDGWYPGDEWKGDVARIVMYMKMYYNESFSEVGDLETFLKWNVEDPVSDFEIQRNDVIEGAQGNRNPFIDNPYLATLIWGGNAAENTWE